MIVRFPPDLQFNLLKIQTVYRIQREPAGHIGKRNLDTWLNSLQRALSSQAPLAIFNPIARWPSETESFQTLHTYVALEIVSCYTRTHTHIHAVPFLAPPHPQSPSTFETDVQFLYTAVRISVYKLRARVCIYIYIYIYMHTRQQALKRDR